MIEAIVEWIYPCTPYLVVVLALCIFFENCYFFIFFLFIKKNSIELVTW